MGVVLSKTASLPLGSWQSRVGPLSGLDLPPGGERLLDGRPVVQDVRVLQLVHDVRPAHRHGLLPPLGVAVGLAPFRSGGEGRAL